MHIHHTATLLCIKILIHEILSFQDMSWGHYILGALCRLLDKVMSSSVWLDYLFMINTLLCHWVLLLSMGEILEFYPFSIAV